MILLDMSIPAIIFASLFGLLFIAFLGGIYFILMYQIWNIIIKGTISPKQIIRLYKMRKRLNNVQDFDLKKSNDMFDLLMIISLYFIKWDNKISNEEMEYIKIQLKTSLGEKFTKRAINFIQEHKDDMVSLKQIEERVKSSLSYRTKLLMLHYLLGLTMVDGLTSEIKALGSFAGNIGIDPKEWELIQYLGMNKSLSESKIFKDKLIKGKKDSLKDSYETMYAKVNIKDESLGETKIQENAEILLDDLKDHAKRTEGFEQSISEKIKASKNNDVKAQYDIMSGRLENFTGLLAQKFNTKEATYIRYKSVFEEVFMLALKNLEKVIDIDEFLDGSEIAVLRERLNEKGAQSNALKDRLSMYEKEIDKQKEILVLNEKVISEMEGMIFKMNKLKSQDKSAQNSMDVSIDELKQWAEKTKLYQ